MKRIYLLRHSMPDENSTLQNEYIPLSQVGKDLAKKLVDKLSVTSPIKVFSSPYIRAKQTAEAFSFDVITSINSTVVTPLFTSKFIHNTPLSIDSILRLRSYASYPPDFWLMYYFNRNDLYYKSFQPFSLSPTMTSSDSLSKPFSTMLSACE